MSKIRVKQIDESELNSFVRSATSGDLNSISGSISGLTSSGNTLSGEYGNLVSIVNILSGQNTGISGRLSTIESEFSAFDTQVNNFSGEVYDLSGQIVTLSDNLNLFSGDLATTETDIYTLQSDVLFNSGRLDSVSGNLNTYSGYVLISTGVINSNISTLSGRIDTVSGNLNTTSGKLDSLSGSFTGVSGDLYTLVNDYVKVADVKNSGVSGGAYPSIQWVTRDINRELVDNSNICSISSNTITLSGGVYRCNINCPAWQIGSHVARLYNVSTSGVLITGSTQYGAASVSIQTASNICGQFSLSSTGAILRIEHIGETIQAVGHALGVGLTCSGVASNIYTVAEFWRTST